MKEEKIPSNLVVFNYKSTGNTIPSVDEVPTLVKDAVLKELQANDSNPFYKIEAIDYPVNGSGGVYEASFFKSFINVCKQRPIPGSKRGHEFTSRPSSDFYMVGGSTVDNSDGTGTAYFKMYIPPNGDPTDNSGFIRDARAGIVNFSLVSAPEYNVKKDKDGVERRHFTKSNGYERNDAVEFGAGAMSQVVNSKEVINFDEAREMIESGLISRNDKGETLYINGKVSRPMLRRMVANADCENKAEVAELISLIDKKKNGGSTMNELDEAIQMVKNAAANGKVNLGETFKDSITLRNADDVKNAEIVKELNERKLDIAGIDKMIAENKANANAIAKNAVSTAFGAESFEVGVNGKKESVKNAAHEYAMQKCAGKYGADLDKEINSLKDDVVMKSIRANQADPFSAVNRIVENGAAKPGERKSFNA